MPSPRGAGGLASRARGFWGIHVAASGEDEVVIARSEIAERLRVAAADAGLAAGSVLAGMARFFEPDPPASLS